MSNPASRPYLVVPKLVEQPTWGGEYIASMKGWQDRPELKGKRIGQSYELFSGSNLSLCVDSDDPNFVGELADRDSVQLPSTVPNTVPLAKLVAASAKDVFGEQIAKERGDKINLLIKLTQALGNSFQIHIKDGQTDPYWRPKPESWYYFEPGLITMGVKPGVWQEYRAAVEAVDAGMHKISAEMRAGQLTYDQARPKIQALIQQHNPWQFVNEVEVAKDEVIDASCGALHHSWEEDPVRAPLGNVLYELQIDTMDDVGTMRSFDRGKIGTDGTLREVHIDDYFKHIDRSPEINDPAMHKRQPKPLTSGEGFTLVSLLQTRYYSLDKLTFVQQHTVFTDKIVQFEHLFVQSGSITVATSEGEVRVGTGHSCFVPARAGEYTVKSETPNAEVLISR